jgi:hypothetical protein
MALHDMESNMDSEIITLSDGYELTNDELHEWYQELDALRDSGDINMFGAPRWLMDSFDLGRVAAREIFAMWTKQFDPHESIHND